LRSPQAPGPIEAIGECLGELGGGVRRAAGHVGNHVGDLQHVASGERFGGALDLLDLPVRHTLGAFQRRIHGLAMVQASMCQMNKSRRCRGEF
jgi:hypothetical protein